MKLIMYNSNGFPHIKNFDNIQRMCKSCSIEFEFTNDINRAFQPNYDILILNDKFYDPLLFPESVKIIYGPQLWVIPEGPIIGPLNESLKGRCVYNSLSKWVENYVLTVGGSFIMPITQFPFAVETNYFKPAEPPVEKTLDCIVYIKNRFKYIIDESLKIIEDKRLKYKIFKYGSYSQLDYINSLHSAKFMITLDAHESQGYALQEAMSCNVPLLVLNATTFYDESTDGITSTYEKLKPKSIPASSVPYWSDECGIKIENVSELSTAIDTMMIKYIEFTPRNYIVNNFSNEVCMKRILDYFKLGNQSASTSTQIQSSYATKLLSYSDLFSTLTWLVKPKCIVEFGILNGYSLDNFIKGSSESTQIHAYDIFEKFNGKSAKRDIVDKFKQYKNVQISEGDYYDMYNHYEEKSIDILHIDIANDGNVYEFAFNNYISKISDNGILILEGGSEERDNVEWMKKYNKVSIKGILNKYKNRLDIHTIDTFPSVTIVRKISFQ